MEHIKELALVAILSLVMVVVGSGWGEPRVTGAALATGMIGSGFIALLVLASVVEWILR